MNLSAVSRTNKKNIVSPILEQAKDTIAEPHLFAGAGGMRMGLLYLSLESGFLCFTVLPDGLVPHLHPASVSFPPRSPGERTKQ